MIDLAIIISSCNKYSSLWQPNIECIKRNWIGEIPDIYIITDFPTDQIIEGAKVLAFEGNVPQRLKSASSSLNYRYFLVSLDDYFLIDKVLFNDMSFFVDLSSKNMFHYLQLYDRRQKKKKTKRVFDVKSINLKKDYAVCLYPAIWEKSFLEYCTSFNCSPWEFEPKLTKLALNYGARCFYAEKRCFEILDVIRKGKLLHKARRYLKKHKIDIGEWEVVPVSQELKLFFMDRFTWYAPKFLYNFAKWIAHKFGKKFYSDSKDEI